jgi:ectoine hydroxylase-related dioxygenase (phytanoyl-CoA dioxygenase family)
MMNTKKSSFLVFLSVCLWIHTPLLRSTVVLSFSTLSILFPKSTNSLATTRKHISRPLHARLHPATTKTRNRIKHHHKNDVDALVIGMGLQTVPSLSTEIVAQLDPGVSHATCSVTNEIDMEIQLNYSRNGHAVLRNFITPTNANLSAVLTKLQEHANKRELDAWRQKVHVACNSSSRNDCLILPISKCETIEDCQAALRSLGVNASLPFLQYFNTWQSIPEVKDLAVSLGQAASILLDVPTIRLYQDALFWKRPHDGPTPWHVDARMAPFDTSHMITFWIPLQDVPKGGTALVFCSKSHADISLPYWNPPPQQHNDDVSPEWDRLELRYPKRLVDYMPMRIGDVTVHSGWTLHCSSGNNGKNGNDRMAIAITFVDGESEIRPDWQNVGDNEDRWSYEAWCKEVAPRARFTHDLVPIVWPAVAL